MNRAMYIRLGWAVLIIAVVLAALYFAGVRIYWGTLGDSNAAAIGNVSGVVQVGDATIGIFHSGPDSPGGTGAKGVGAIWHTGSDGAPPKDTGGTSVTVHTDIDSVPVDDVSGAGSSGGNVSQGNNVSGEKKDCKSKCPK